MTAHIFFLHLMAILIAARLFAELAVRLQVPAVIGELLAGVVLGPSVLGWLDLSDPIRLLAEIGIIMLLFEVGLETDVGRLIATGLRSLWVATLGFVAPFVLGFAISYWLFGLSLLAALFVGGTLTATSIGITVRVLTDLKRHHSREAQVVLGAAVLDDVMGVVLLAVLYEFYLGGDINLVNAGKVALFVGIFFILAPLVAKLISLPIKRVESATEIPGLIPTAIVALVLFFTYGMGHRRAGIAGRVCRRPGPVAALLFPLGYRDTRRPGFCPPYRRPDELHHSFVHADLFRLGGLVAQFAGDRLVVHLYLGVFAERVCPGDAGEADRRPGQRRKGFACADRRPGHVAARRSGADLRGAGTDLGHHERGAVRRHGDRDRIHHLPAASGHQGTLPPLRASPRCAAVIC
jgi:hypothetical protein